MSILLTTQGVVPKKNRKITRDLNDSTATSDEDFKG